MTEPARISIEMSTDRVRVFVAGTEVANTERALILRERGHSARFYIPAADVATERLRPSATNSACPHKGVAEYFHVATDAGLENDVAWSYPTPLAGVADISGHLSFWGDRTDIKVG